MRLPRNVRVFGIASFLTDVHSEIVMPLLPLFVTGVLGLPAAFLGLVEGVAESTASFLKMGSGWASDRLGRRKGLIVSGYAFSAVVKPLLALATTGWHVLGIRFGDRVGKGIRTSPRDAALAEAVPESQRGAAFGFHRAMDTFGAVVGTTIAFVLMVRTEENFRAIFLWAGIPGILAVLILALFVREKPASKAPGLRPLAKRGRVAVPRPLIWFLAVHGVFCLADFTYALFLLRAQNLEISPAVVPLVYLVYNVAYASLPIRVGRLSDRWGRIPVLLFGYALAAVTCLGFALADHTWMTWGLFVLYGVRSAVVETIPRALVSDLCEKERRGTGLGVFHFVAGITALPASFVAGTLWDTLGPEAPFFLAAGLSLLAALLLAALARRIGAGLAPRG
jgi:MFS family permease